MSGFYLLDVPEFAPLAAAALRTGKAREEKKIGCYRFIAFEDRLDIERADTGLSEGRLVWLPHSGARRQDRPFRFAAPDARRYQRTHPSARLTEIAVSKQGRTQVRIGVREPIVAALRSFFANADLPTRACRTSPQPSA